MTFNSYPQPTEIIETLANDFESNLENEITSKKKLLDINEKKLSTILRDIESNPQLADNKVLKDLKMDGKKGKGKDNGKDWTEYQSLMLYSGDSKLGKAQLYFDSLATLREKISNLEGIQKAFKGLLGSGLNIETRCLVYHEDGVPKKLVFSPPTENSYAKISLKGTYFLK